MQAEPNLDDLKGRFQRAGAVTPNAPTAPKEIMLRVIDTLATQAPRTHELELSGKRKHRYTFNSPDHAVEVPYDAALRLTAIDGFIVLDHAGNRILPAEQNDRAGKKIILQADECIARFEELTKDALGARVKRKFGAAPQSGSKEELIAMLVGSNVALGAPAPVAVTGSDGQKADTGESAEGELENQE